MNALHYVLFIRADRVSSKRRPPYVYCYVAENSCESQVLIPQTQESLYSSFPRARDIGVPICISYSMHVGLDNMHLIEEDMIRYSMGASKTTKEMAIAFIYIAS